MRRFREVLALLLLVTGLTTAGLAAGGSFAGASHRQRGEEKAPTAAHAAQASAVYLRGVSCVRRTWCIAVGNTGDALDGQAVNPLADLWNGSTWTSMSVPTDQGGHLAAVSCVSTHFCAALGDTGSGSLFEMWDGATWTVVGRGGTALSGVSCRTTKFCVAVGGPDEESVRFSKAGSSYVWNGSTWRFVKMPKPPDVRWSFLSAVSCRSRTFCLAAGQFQKNNNQYRTLIERWHGGAWKLLSSPNLHHGGNYKDDFLQGVSCGSPQYCLAVGYYDAGGMRKNTTAPHLLALFYVRQHFTLAKPPVPWGATSSYFNTASGNCAVYCMAGGEFFTGHYYSDALAESWNARTHRFALRKPGHFPGQAQANFTGVSCENSTACMAVGWYSTQHVDFPTRAAALAASWNGAYWRLRPTP